MHTLHCAVIETIYYPNSNVIWHPYGINTYVFPIWVAYGVDICNYYGICHIVPICTTYIVLNDTVVYIVQVSLRKC